MSSRRSSLLAVLVLVALCSSGAFAAAPTFDLGALDKPVAPNLAPLIEKNGFAIMPGNHQHMADIYKNAKKYDTPQFVTTDAILHGGHVFFDYLLRILEIEHLYSAAVALTDVMYARSMEQYEAAGDPETKELARLNVGYFAVAKTIIDPSFVPDLELGPLVDAEMALIGAHSDLVKRPLLLYVPEGSSVSFVKEDYTQYVPRGHYTRNETFETYFRLMMWYGRIDFKLRPGKSDMAKTTGVLMTTQALLMADALANDAKAMKLWKSIYEPTVFFVGAADDLTIFDYQPLIEAHFPGKEPDRFADKTKVEAFIDEALKLHAPKIASSESQTDDGPSVSDTMGFRLIGQRFIPDSYMFQKLVYGDEELLFEGKGKPFTMEVVAGVGPARAFPRGLDVFAVLGSKRALELLTGMGDTAYKGYDDQLVGLQEEFAATTAEEWGQNLYYGWFHAFLPLLEAPKGKKVPAFATTDAWLDRTLLTALGSWTELRHDTILYAKQSYTKVRSGSGLKKKGPSLTKGYVDPYPEVFARTAKMLRDLEGMLDELGIAVDGVPKKIDEFASLAEKLSAMATKELAGKKLTEKEQKTIWTFGVRLGSLTSFPKKLMDKIGSAADKKMDIIADVHTEPSTKQVLEEAVGKPMSLLVYVDDGEGPRIAVGAVFSYYEFKQPMADRLTDEAWQKMGLTKQLPAQPAWVEALMTK